ncbi:MAG TPA: RNA polymerase sigma factor SigZ [Ohtaekwangia sp.]
MEVTTIYNQFHAQLLAYIRSKIRSREDAEDILQNVFIRISSGVDKLNEDEKLKNWIFTITRNAVIDYYRTNASKKNMGVTAEIDENMPEEDVVDATKGLDQCMSTMISLLPEEYRDIIIESEIHGVKQKDLADKYGIAYPSLRSRVQRGRERLKQLFYNCCHIKTDSLGNVIEAQSRSDCGSPCSPCSEE